jgi:putative nucleotidyltransferase with HDIG domain
LSSGSSAGSADADVASVLANWRRRPEAVAIVATATFTATAVVVAAGGPPTAWTHLYYFVVLGAAVLWGPWWGLAMGAVSGILAGPISEAIVGHVDAGDARWIVRAVAMMLVGWACGSLARALLRRLDELEQVNEETIFAFVRAIDARDPNTARHSEQVSEYSAALATALGLEPQSVERIRQAALLHDVGKVALERSVLQKPGLLTPEEWDQVRDHPVQSAHIISCVQRFASYVPGARHHHERYDGTGYPDGLMREDIPLDARIISVADAYEAMTSDRAYRIARSREEALGCLMDGAGTQFDPACVAAFLSLDLAPAAAVAHGHPIAAG